MIAFSGNRWRVSGGGGSTPICLHRLSSLLYGAVRTLDVEFCQSVPRPSSRTLRTASSTEVYDNEDNREAIPSLMLEPSGEDRSVINRHFPGWWGLGITPKRLICSLQRR